MKLKDIIKEAPIAGHQTLMLDMLSRDFEYYVENMLSRAIGKKFVM